MAKAKPNNDGISELGERFALEYIQDLNATAAYLRIQPKVKPASAATEAWKLMRQAAVQARIAELKAEQADRLKISADRVLRELAICGFSDTKDYAVDDAGRLELTEGAHKLATRAISSVKHRTITKGGDDPEVVHEVEYRLWDKVSSLKALGQHLKLFDEEQDRGKITLTVKFVRE